MEITGEHRFAAPRELVWSVLHDPGALRTAMPGCQRLEPRGPDAFDVTLAVGIATLKGTYTGTVAITDVAEPESYGLRVTALGKLGEADGTARLRLEPAGAGTVVRYAGEIRSRGGIARLGGRVIAGSARLLIAQFFRGIEREVDLRRP